MFVRYLLVGIWIVFILSSSYAEVPFAQGELLIKLKPTLQPLSITLKEGVITTGLPSLDSLNKKFKASFMEKVFWTATPPTIEGMPDLRSWYKIKLPEETDILKVAEEYKKDPNVIYAEPNYKLTLFVLPNDLHFSKQWGLHNTGQTGGTADADIDAPEAWSIHTGSGVVVAVIDTGVDWDHPDLADNIWKNMKEEENRVDDDKNGYIDDVRGWDFYSGGPHGNGDNDPMDEDGHGTHCAGIISAVTNNGIGVAGVGWANKIMALRIFGGNLEAFASNAANAIKYAADNGAKVLSNSWGFIDPEGDPGPFPDVVKEAIDYAIAKGCVVIFAAGNKNRDDLYYPAAYPPVIAVAATDHNDIKAGFSNYGKWIDVSAPGENIYSTLLNNTYGYMSGTSMACPFVAGLAGLIYSYNPGLSNSEVRQRIEQSADNIDNKNSNYVGMLGSGRINVFRAFPPPPIPLGKFGIRKVYNYPNPFVLHSGKTTIRIELESEVSCEDIIIEIYDIAGELVHKVDSNKIIQNGKVYEYSWDGKNDQERLVGSGVYIYQVKVKGDEGKEEVFFGKLVVVK